VAYGAPRTCSWPTATARAGCTAPSPASRSARGRISKLIREDAIKPTPTELGIDTSRLAWERSGDGNGSIEIAFPLTPRWSRGDWVLMRVVGDPAGRVLVFDRNEWECFLDGVRKGEFDNAADLTSESIRLGP
jgi:hypothetical protein